MKMLEIKGGNPLSGTIRISGAKNSVVALIPAAILSSEEVTICNVPDITDTTALCEILEFLNVDVKRATESLVINPTNMENKEIPSMYTKKLRASYYFMGAMLGSSGKNGFTTFCNFPLCTLEMGRTYIFLLLANYLAIYLLMFRNRYYRLKPEI